MAAAEQSGFYRLKHIALKIRTLLSSLPQQPSGYDEITPKIGFWIEYVLREQFTTVDELVEGVSSVAWDHCISYESVACFLKEFRDEPHRSEQARSFVDKLCEHILRWFTIVSVENLSPAKYSELIGEYKEGTCFIGAASLIGHLIERDLFSHELVRRHLIKPLTAHHYTDRDGLAKSVRAMAIYQLFVAARNPLLQGLLEPEDVQACFKALDAKISPKVPGPDAAKLNELREFYATWLKRKGAGQRDAEPGGEEGESMVAAESPPEVGTPLTSVPKSLSAATIDIDIPSFTLRSTVLPPILQDTVSPSETFVNIPATAPSSPSLSISTVSDVTPTELGEIEHSEEQTTIHHKTFYLEDGNVEITCGHTIFRVHSPVVSFSSSKLRDILSPSSLLNAPMPEGCPRIALSDNAEDFEVLLKMIYTPGFPARNKVPEFAVFASLLRMAAKYSFSDVCEQLIGDLKGAYPTKWEDFQAARVLGEDVFGSPKPHPNAVLNLFLKQSVKFALPFAAYRASLGGFPALISDTTLPRLTLASIIYGKGEMRRVMTRAAHMIVHKKKLLSVCPDTTCALNVGIKHMERRVEEMIKLHDVMIGERRGGVLSPPQLGDLACVKCTKEIEASHVGWRRDRWELLPVTFSVAKCWDEVM